MSEKLDLIVVGLGAWGSATLYHAARRGLRVLGIDRFAPPHKKSGHHGAGRVIRMASPEAPGYTPMMKHAYQLWSELEEEYGDSLISEVGGLYIGCPGSEIIEGSLASYKDIDTKYELLEAAEARRRFPAVTVHDGEQAVWEPSAGVIRPEHGIRAHLHGAVSAGARLALNEPMTDWSDDGEAVTVETSKGRYRAPKVVLSLGAWSPPRFRLSLPLVPERQVVAIYDARDAGRLPIFVAGAEEAEVVYGLPEEGDTYKAALHHGGRTGEPDALLDEPDDAELALLERCVAERLPALAGKRQAAYTCIYCNTPDRHFVLGPHPEHPRVILASGDSGRGYKFASVIGEILARLGTHDSLFPDLSLFDPLRFAATEA